MEPETCNLKPETGNPKPPRILFLSNLIVSKGIFVLLDACKILKNRGIDFRCRIAGGEGDITTEKLQSAISISELGSIVSHFGTVTDHDKPELYTSSDIFVHPTSSDCLPLVILEAMQYSLPVVSTDEGAIPDAVEDGVNGYVIPVNDPVSLAGKIELLINDSELMKKMGSEGRRKYEMEFTFEKFELRLSDIFSRLSNN